MITAAALPTSSRHRFVVISGLPASGKTTLAGQIAAGLAMPLLDKDDILEALFDGLGAGDAGWRQRLSRASDEVLKAVASRTPDAVLTSFWRHPASDAQGGTPTDWIGALSASIVEIYCQCPVEQAVERFQRRTRRPGHNDAARSRSALLDQFRTVAALGPLGLGRLIRVDTSAAYDVTAVLEAARAGLPRVDRS